MAKEKEAKKNLALKIVAIVLCSIIGLVVLAVVGFSVGENIMFFKFYDDADKEFKIPGLWDGSVPQGFEYIEETETFLYTGYQKDKVSPSVVYIMPDKGEGEERKVELFNLDGSAYTGHVGGITIYGGTTFIATSGGMDIFNTEDILDGDNKATKVGKLQVDFNVAFCEVHEGKLYAGNFYRAVDYETPEKHHMTTPCGDKNTAVIYEYALDPISELPQRFAPDMVYSITDAIQGLAFDDEGRMILSTSWGLSKSHLYVYEKPTQVFEDAFEVEGFKADLCYLDSDTLVEDIIAPPMAEELVYLDGKVYIMNEAASMKYIFGKLTGASWCYAYELKD